MGAGGIDLFPLLFHFAKGCQHFLNLGFALRTFCRLQGCDGVQTGLDLLRPL